MSKDINEIWGKTIECNEFISDEIGVAHLSITTEDLYQAFKERLV